MAKEKHLFTQDIIIRSIDDIDKAIIQVSKNIECGYRIILEDIEPIVFRLIGERFENEYVSIKVLDIANEYKSGFVKYFKTILGNELKENDIYVNIKRNSFEIDFQQLFQTIISKGIDKMDGGQITLIILFALGAWFAKEAYEKYLDKKQNENVTDLAKEAIKALREKFELQKSKNKPVKKALEILDENEKLEYGNTKYKAIYTKNDIDQFNYIEDEQITYETVKNEFHIKELKDKDGKKYVTLKQGTKAKFEAVSKLENNSPLYKAFDNQNPIKLKIIIGKNSQGKIVEADIIEILEQSTNL